MCKCVNINVGSYDNIVELKTPQFMLDIGSVGCYIFRSTVCIDKCIENEIKELWKHKIITINSCCGHNKFRGLIAVLNESINKMKKLGYENAVDEFPDREDIFYAKSV